MIYMETKQILRSIIVVLMLPILITVIAGCSSQPSNEKLPVKVLILPKFEVGEMEGDFPGEAQYFYEEYVAGGEEFDIEGSKETGKLYYKDGVALCLLGQGKVSAAISTTAILSDDRFDLSDAYILSVGCAGSAKGYGIPGDVFVISSAVDYDLGHQADPRELAEESDSTWFHDESFDKTAFIRMDEDLTDLAFEKVKDVKLETTERTQEYLSLEFPGEAWANRQPKVMLGTSVSGDNYWKGIYDHQNALLITKTYKCRDPYAATEMEDVAVGQAAESFGLLDRLIVLRVGVDMDVFPQGVPPEMLWGKRSVDDIASEESIESVDIFETAMKNCYDTGKVLIDMILEGDLQQKEN